MARQDGGASVVAQARQILDTGEGKQQSIRLQVAEVVECQQGECPMDVDKMQKKLAIWAQDPDFRFDDIYNLLYEENWLRRAYRSVKSNHGSRTAGVDHQTISDFAEDLAENIDALAQNLRGKDLQPQPVRRTYIPKGDGRKRPLGIPTIKDRIV
jgi:retron-type reverse transcriptase